jgi:alkaline phosphatase D
VVTALGACADPPPLPSLACPPGTRRGAEGRCILEHDRPEGVVHLTVSVRTGDGEGDGANGHLAEVCLAEGLCLPLDLPNADVLRPGATDVVHREDLVLPPGGIDRVVLRSLRDGGDAWRPACVAVAVDGELVHCEDQASVLLGRGEGAVASWTDPDGVHLGCGSCADDALTHGPLVGEVGPGDARLMVRTDASRDVTVHLHDLEDAAAGVSIAAARTAPADDFTTVFHLEGLAPARRYHAVFDVDGAPSRATATFRTAPAAGSRTVLRLGFGTCARVPPQAIFEVARRERLDLFVFGGDNTYADTAQLDGHWAHLRAALEHRARGDFVASTPTVATWDDHDFVGDNSDRLRPGGDVARRAFADYWANRSLGTPAVPGVFSVVPWGNVDIFLLDVRTHRSPAGEGDGSLLGDGQTAWLEQQLSASTATFKLLVSGTAWAHSAGETWLDVPRARRRLFDFLATKRIGGVVLLAGDLHRAMLRRIPRPGAYALPEIISSPLAVPRTWRCPPPTPDAEELACFDGGNSFALITIDTTAADPSLDVRMLEEAGREVARLRILRSELD